MINEKDKIKVRLTSYGSLQVITIPVKLHKDSYNIVGLECLVPKVVTEDSTMVKVYASTLDVSGTEVWSSATYDMVYQQDVPVGNDMYEQYTCPMPEEFCSQDGDITLTFAQVFVNDNQEITSTITSGNLNLYIDGSGYNFAGVQMANTDYIASEINNLKQGQILAMGLKPYSPTFLYPINTVVYGLDGNGDVALYKSMVADNIGNPLNDENYWQVAGLSGAKGDSVFIRYSPNANGSLMSDIWRVGYGYIGFYTGRVASDNYLDYQWSEFRGPQGMQGERGLQGVAGPIGPQGPQGVTGATGPRGEKGDSGNDFTIIGTVSATADLPQNYTDADVGKAWFVGTQTPRDVWSWGYNENNILAWINQGKLQGPVGEQGPQGIQGLQGIQGIQGETGPQGLQGETGKDGLFFNSQISMANPPSAYSSTLIELNIGLFNRTPEQNDTFISIYRDTLNNITYLGLFKVIGISTTLVGVNTVEYEIVDQRLYNTTGQNTDGSMTQKAITDAINGVTNTVSELNTNKANKATGATANNLASLDVNGNLKDSGIATDNGSIVLGTGGSIGIRSTGGNLIQCQKTFVGDIIFDVSLVGNVSNPCYLYGSDDRPSYNKGSGIKNMALVEDVNNLSMLPSGVGYSSGTITMVGTQLTAPCNGYLQVYWNATTAGGYVSLANHGSGLQITLAVMAAGNYPTAHIPVKTGDVITITYSSEFTNGATYYFMKSKEV